MVNATEKGRRNYSVIFFAKCLENVEYNGETIITVSGKLDIFKYFIFETKYFNIDLMLRLIIVVPLDSVGDFHVHRLLDCIFQVNFIFLKSF